MLNKFSRERNGILKKVTADFYEFFIKLNTVDNDDENNNFDLTLIIYFDNE